MASIPGSAELKSRVGGLSGHVRYWHKADISKLLGRAWRFYDIILGDKNHPQSGENVMYRFAGAVILVFVLDGCL